MNLTFFIGGLSGGGAERVLCNIANYMCGNHNVEIVTMSDDRATYHIDESINRISLISKSEKKNFISDNIKRYARLFCYVLKHRDRNYVVFLPITIIMLLSLSIFINGEIIVSERGDPTRYSSFVRFLLKKLIHKADGIVFQTNDAEKWYKNYLKNCKSIIIPNAINPEFLCETEQCERDNIIVSVGRLCDQKNFKLLIDCFNNIHRDYPEYKLIIYGEGPNRFELENQICIYGLCDSVSLPGYSENIRDVYKKAKVFVLTSDFEGMPNCLMEAMATRVPCIATDCPVGGPAFLINNEENGLLTPVGDEIAISNAIKKVLSDYDTYSEMGNRGYKIRFELAPDIIYKKWEQFICGNK